MSRSPYLVALSNPLNLAMLWISLFAGLLAAWWLLPLGLLLWAVMVWSIARDPLLRMKHAMRKRAPLASRFHGHFEQLEGTQVDIFDAVASAPAGVQRALRSLPPEVNKLMDDVYHLCERMTVLDNYRTVTQSTMGLRAAEDLGAESPEVTDPIVRHEMEEARQAGEDHRQKLETIERQLDRVEAQLVTLGEGMDRILAEVVQAQVLGAELAAQRAPALVTTVRQQIDEVKSFEREADQIESLVL